MLPNFESLKDSKQFLIMYIIIQLCHSKSAGVKGDQINFIFFINNRKDYSESIVQSISFHDELSIGNLVSENRSGSKCLLERVKNITIGEVKLPRNILSDEIYQ